MNTTKRLLCALLALALLITAVPALAEAAPTAHTHDGRLTLLTGSCADGPVRDMDAAARVVEATRDRLGADPRSRFEPARTLTDTAGNRYYVFRQTYADAHVLGGAAKVIADAEGNMLGLTASAVAELPDIEESEGVSARDAEALVLAQDAALALVEGYTAEVVLPLVLSVDDNEHDMEASRFVWVVYTNNPRAGVPQSSDLPYLAHYVTTAGEYLYSLPTILPGDAAGQAGFDASYVFEFMEPAEYTGWVDLADGTEKKLTVTLMRDKRTGMYYLGNIERGIVVADCWSFLYDHGQVKLAYSPDNREWDQVGLMSLYNYCRAWDYYAAIGWPGGDGLRTPILVLNDYCDADHHQVDNACYMGYALGWQLFGASQLNSYSQCLDVVAHEFTHCVTGATLTYNAYINDYGAINEAVSDIQGNLCEMLLKDTDDDSWLVGEHSEEPVRSMSDPHLFEQPEYSWDLYYNPSVKTPTGLNDLGGVHGNSSLLNNVAYRLCEKGGMTLEEARAYWFAVDCAMTPGTDYAQLSELLPFVLEITGMGRYAGALRAALDATRLGDNAMPDAFDADRAMVTLTLPDNELFTDGNWGLEIVSVNVDELIRRVDALMAKVESGDTSDLPALAAAMLESSETNALWDDADFDPGDLLIDLVFDLLFGADDEAEEADEPALTPEEQAQYDELLDWAMEQLDGVIYSDLGAAGQDGRTVNMICRPGRTIPLLLHMRFPDDSAVPDQVTFATFIKDRWFSLEAFRPALDLLLAEDEEAPSLDALLGLLGNEDIQALAAPFVQALLGFKTPEDLLREITFEIKGGEVCEIPAEGLERVQLPAESDFDFGDEAEPVPGRMSRPAED